MKIGILGSGLMGGKLGTLFARAGHHVVFSYSRSAAKLDRLARGAGSRAGHGTPAEAVLGADVILVAVHWSLIDEVLAQAGDLTGKVILSCSLPLNDENSELVIAHRSSGAEALAAKLPGADVVSAFNNIPSEVLHDVYAARGTASPPSMIHCGGSDEAKEVASTLIRDIGFDPVDAGPLKSARFTEPMALLIAELAYEGSAGPELAYRIERFPRPE